MIPNNLAELISSGKAKYKTFCIGATGSARIPLPQDAHIVITDFHFAHFIDRSALSQDSLNVQSLKNVVHTISFASQGERYKYNIRTPFKTEVYEGNEFIVPLESEVVYDTYQVHTTSVHVDIWRLNDFTNWVIHAGKLSNVTAEPPNPNGYGTVNNAPNQNVVTRLEFQINEQNYVPYGDQQGVALENGWRNEFFADINNQSFLNIPAKNDVDCNYTYPIVNIGYVLIKGTYSRSFK